MNETLLNYVQVMLINNGIAVCVGIAIRFQVNAASAPPSTISVL